MHIEAPSRREVWLAVLLLLSLLLISRSNSASSFSSAGTGAQEDAQPHSAVKVQPQNIRDVIKWGTGEVPHSAVVAHVPGWTIIDKLYLLNGTLYIVTDKPDSIPDRNLITSTGINIENGAEAWEARHPTDKEMRIVTPQEAKAIFGPDAQIIDGVSWLTTDTRQFVTHYYHWSAELFFGFWRTYSSLDTSITSTGETILPAPRRMIFKSLDADRWRDYSSMNQWVLRNSFPNIGIELAEDWADRVDIARTFVFDRVVLADRAAAMHGFNFQRTQRTAAEPAALPGSVHWWNTIRGSVVQAAGIGQGIGQGTRSTPVITYISRQSWGRRMLIPEDHDRLVKELYRLRDTYGYEVNIVSMDLLSRKEQLELSARTTIMMGVHGNGLTSLVWMKPTQRSTVIEFFFPGGFAYDYEYTTRALGMVHYGFWNDKSFTSPDVPEVAYPDGFQGNEIPIDGAAVARLCLERLTLSDEADD
ncbi:hypothetical protein FIBSPDRAFT_1043561 [Athelia psychrophila]|uniref:Glycosyltransferase 61 catalytic domain-containing protein n=1 Tax=Athelia psychrophila TaxID=1759441 RepID=A0A166L2S4_9AGAM|nr:hypothetical protein FIBSPDRAFT_1043561 [Fibularhizoctonia sp. CBS 109695]